MASKILKKLTIRDVIGNKAAILAYAMMGQTVSKDATGKEVRSASGSAVPLLRVLGQVTGFKAGESDYGSYVELKGAFQGTNLQTGEITEGVSKCILPDAVGEPLANAMHNGAESVEFAVEIFVKYNETAATMYEYEAMSLLKPQTPKPIESLFARMQAEGIAMTVPLKLAAPILTPEQINAQENAGLVADAARKSVESKANVIKLRK